MSGMKKTGSGAGVASGSAGKPAATKPTISKMPQASLTSFFKPAASTSTSSAASSSSVGTSSATPSSSSASALSVPASSAQVAASYFGNATIAPSSGAKPRPPAALPSTPSRTANSSSLGAPSSGGASFTTPPSSAAKKVPTSAFSATSTPSEIGRKRKEISYAESDEEEEERKSGNDKENRSASKKTKRVNDDDEYDGGGAAMSDDDDEQVASGNDDDDFGGGGDDEEDDEPAPKKGRGGGGSAKKSSAPSSGKKPAKSKAKSKASKDDDDDDENTLLNTSTAHHGGKAYSTPFLNPKLKKDLSGILYSDPRHDPTTLYISPSDMAKFTPGEKQYWELKQRNNDLVFFFKVGKFYEMFDEDAEVGVRELDLAYMQNQQRPHCGFPEMALSQLSMTKYAEKLVTLGYKVGRIDQTQTPAELKAANAKAKPSEKQKAVRRELSQVLTPGTLVDSDILKSDFANHLLVLTERELTTQEIADQLESRRTAAASGVALPKEMDENVSDVVEIGFAYVDCTTGRFILGQRRDDKQRSFLKTLLGFVSPREIVLPKSLSVDTNTILKYELRSDIVTNFAQFWNTEQTVKEIHEKGYYAQVKKESASSSSSKSTDTWPIVLQQMLAEHQDLAISAFGTCIQYLRRTMNDFELVSQRYVSKFQAGGSDADRVLALDGQTLANLEVVKNQHGTAKGTLLEWVDRTSTPFGKRRIKEWLMRPLFQQATILQRQNAVQFLMAHPELSDSLRGQLKKIPDLERFLSRIHANGLKKTVNVVMYENVTAKHIDVFIKTINGLAAIGAIIRQVQHDLSQENPPLESDARLAQLLTFESDGGLLPDFSAALEKHRAAFNHEDAVKAGRIKPNKGIDVEYDDCVQEVEKATRALDDYLATVQRQLKAGSTIKYVHKNKEKYQLEIPIRYKDQLGSEFQFVSGTKAVQRYWTKTSQKLAERLGELELQLEKFELDMTRRVFAAFAEKYQLWIGTVEVIAELDCLLSLAHISQHHPGCVRPQFVSFEENHSQSILNLRQAYHPTLYEAEVVNKMMSQTNFIPNDTVIGCEENPSRFILVSGPNMGGKSTLLRQTCCAVILAQMGAWVPAESFQLTPIDRIFTRVGANDKIMAGQSTFLVELMETSHILKNATDRSLVILDELGRGTSTFDGTAIAYAVIRYLSETTRCLTLFATHYHMLMDEFRDDPLISMYHMSCQVNSDETDVTFLYKFIPGVCPKSFGGNVARAAGLPDHLIQRAQHMSTKFEARCTEGFALTKGKLEATYPEQKDESKVMLPRSTLDAINKALESGDLATLFQMKMKFETCQSKYAQQKQKQQQQQAATSAMQE